MSDINKKIVFCSEYEKEELLKEKKEIKRLTKSLRGMKQRFNSNPNNFGKNCKLMISEIYKVLNYEDEKLYALAYKTYGEVVELLKIKTGTNQDIELFMFVLDGFMYKFSEKASQLYWW